MRFKDINSSAELDLLEKKELVDLANEITQSPLTSTNIKKQINEEIAIFLNSNSDTIGIKNTVADFYNARQRTLKIYNYLGIHPDSMQDVFTFMELSSHNSLSKKETILLQKLLKKFEQGNLLEKVMILPTDNNYNSFFWAAHQNNYDFISKLIPVITKNTRIVNSIFSSHEGNNEYGVLTLCTKNNSVQCLKEILNLALSNGSNRVSQALMQKDKIGYTPLNIASRHGFYDCVDIILNYANNIGEKLLHKILTDSDNVSSNNALMWAIIKKHYSIIKALLHHIKSIKKAEDILNLKNKLGETAITLVKNSNDKNLKELFKNFVS